MVNCKGGITLNQWRSVAVGSWIISVSATEGGSLKAIVDVPSSGRRCYLS